MCPFHDPCVHRCPTASSHQEGPVRYRTVQYRTDDYAQRQSPAIRQGSYCIRRRWRIANIIRSRPDIKDDEDVRSIQDDRLLDSGSGGFATFTRQDDRLIAISHDRHKSSKWALVIRCLYPWVLPRCSTQEISGRGKVAGIRHSWLAGMRACRIDRSASIPARLDNYAGSRKV